MKSTTRSTSRFARATAAAAATVVAAALGATALPATATAAPAHASRTAGTTSLAEVLAADGHHVDHNWNDFDILDAAIAAVLAAKPTSPVAVLADGSVRLTAFLPTDEAFRRLVGSLTGHQPRTEAKTLSTLVKVVDVDTIEQVLLYHVIFGKTLASPRVIKAAKAGTKLKTALGPTVRVYSIPKGIALADKARQLPNPHVVLSALDINKGNKQIAHGIDRVLLPINP